MIGETESAETFEHCMIMMLMQKVKVKLGKLAVKLKTS